jgi:Transglycosylase SLT domain
MSRTSVRRPQNRSRSVLLAFSFAVAIAFLLVNVVDPYSGAANAATAYTVVTTDYHGRQVQTFVVAGAYQNVVSRDAVSVQAPPPPPPPTQTASKSAGGSSGAPAAGTPDPGSAQAIAYADLQARGWGDQYNCLVALWNKESHWNVYAYNPSGAYGIPQALPGDKMASAGADWATNPATQITWGLGYIASRWGTPCAAWAHSQAAGWY